MLLITVNVSHAISFSVCVFDKMLVMTHEYMLNVCVLTDGNCDTVLTAAFVDWYSDSQCGSRL